MRRIKTYILAMLLLSAATTASADKARILEQKQGSITFVVDENLPKPKNDHFNWMTQADRLKGLGAATYYGLDNSYIAA